MNLHNPTLMLGLVSSLAWVLCLVDVSLAFPSLVMPRLHRSVDNEVGVDNKNMGFPQTDDEVLELEQLRDIHPDESAAVAAYNHQKKSEPIVAEEPQPLILDDETLPELEQQLESATPQLHSTQGPPQVPVESAAETPEVSSGGEQARGSVAGHRPPTLQSNDGGKAETNGEKPKVKCRLGGMHGAARLVYGQNPEVLPTTSTASTSAATTTKSTTTTTAPPPPPPPPEESSKATSDDSGNASEAAVETAEPIEPATAVDAIETVANAESPAETVDVADTQPAEAAVTEAPVITETPTTAAPTQPPRQLYAYKPLKPTKKPNREEEPERQLIGDVIIDESVLHKSTSRRSVALMAPKTAESLLRHGNGQYSSFDMAQYVFWTGDEAGVARAVEELIQQDMMTREDALKFLHEIRVGIEYLQKSYANRIFPEEIRHNTVKKSFIPKPSTTTTTTTSTTTTTTPKPILSYLNFEQNLEDPENMNLAKTLNNIALWHKLQAMNNNNNNNNNNNQERQENSEDDNEIRRPKISDCDHKEYNLEEIIYKLARIMFTESLAHGDEAQREIQKLMDFFEREHELGIIPLDLEQKVIHVLLQALSDTLTEKPELWPAAQYPYNRLLRSYAHTSYMRPSPTNV